MHKIIHVFYLKTTVAFKIIYLESISTMFIQIRVSEKVFIKDPESSQLGKKIIAQSICLIDKLGLEKFNFKRLAKKIDSTEASVYRYFKNKHSLLLYLILWYWSWIEYRIDYATNNLRSPKAKLETAIGILTLPIKRDNAFPHIDENALYQVVISESPKVYLTKTVDQEEKAGYFETYEKVVDRIAKYLIAINPNYAYPHALVSTVVETAHNQEYFAKHLPPLTEFKTGEEEKIVAFLLDLIYRTIES